MSDSNDHYGISSHLQQAGLNQLIGESPLFREAKERILVVARTDSPVLLYGESGTGKELCARSIHYLGPRADKPFIPINCGALPEQLVENELFGHAKGSYTGALDVYRGLVADASGGTLFLDEISCLSDSARIKLLRFLEDGKFKAIGSSDYCKSDVRIISATNVNLQREVEEGRFRGDLYYRINVLNISLPPLRRRPNDIPLLVNHYLQEFSARHGKHALGISEEAMKALCQYRWPGNVRELKNVVEKVVVFAKKGIIGSEDLDISAKGEEPAPQIDSLKSFKQSAEKEFLTRALRMNDWNISRTAKITGQDRRSLQRLIKKYGIVVVHQENHRQQNPIP